MGQIYGISSPRISSPVDMFSTINTKGKLLDGGNFAFISYLLIQSGDVGRGIAMVLVAFVDIQRQSSATFQHWKVKS